MCFLFLIVNCKSTIKNHITKHFEKYFLNCFFIPDFPIFASNQKIYTWKK